MENQIQPYIKKFHLITKWNSIQECKIGLIFKTNQCNIQDQSINVIHHVNKLKKRNQKFISIDSEKAYDIIQYPFMTKVLSKLRTDRNFLDWIKSSYKNRTANISCNGKWLNALTLKSGTKWTSFSRRMGENIYKICTK